MAPDALGGPQINESTLSTVPFAAEATRARAAERAAFADGATHADGADRAAVADALSHVDVKEQPFEILGGGDDEDEAVIVLCRPGLVPVSGGYRLARDSDLGFMLASSPEPAGWRIALFDPGEPDDGFSVHGTAYAICVKADGT